MCAIFIDQIQNENMTYKMLSIIEAFYTVSDQTKNQLNLLSEKRDLLKVSVQLDTSESKVHSISFLNRLQFTGTACPGILQQFLDPCLHQNTLKTVIFQ